MSGILDRFRQRLEKITDKAYAASAKIKSKVITQRVDVINQQNELVSMKSSWIRAFAYDNRSQTLYMTTHKGKTYSWTNIPPQIAFHCIRGDATCTTTDKQQRWWKGKNPSLGAAYWQYLKGKPMTMQSGQMTIGQYGPQFAVNLTHNKPIHTKPITIKFGVNTTTVYDNPAIDELLSDTFTETIEQRTMENIKRKRKFSRAKLLNQKYEKIRKRVV